MGLIIRNEKKNEYRAVEELTREAFWNNYVPGCSEHYCLHNMRSSSDFITELDFVAELDGKVVGNIVFVHGTVIDGEEKIHEVIGFGPVSVLPAYQRQGIGSSLIKYSLEKARDLGFSAVLIYGNPKYYHRFGFRCAEKYDITNSEGKYAATLMALELAPGTLRQLSGRFVESATYKVDEAGFEEYDKTFPSKEKIVTESQAEFRVIAGLVY